MNQGLFTMGWIPACAGMTRFLLQIVHLP